MLRWALLFLALAVAAAFSPMAGLDASARDTAKVLCFAALALFVVFVALGATSFRRVTW